LLSTTGAFAAASALGCGSGVAAFKPKAAAVCWRGVGPNSRPEEELEAAAGRPEDAGAAGAARAGAAGGLGLGLGLGLSDSDSSAPIPTRRAGGVPQCGVPLGCLN